MQNFECAICNELICQPTTLLCNHSFCISCVNRTRKVGKNSIACPLCRRKTDISPDDKLCETIMLRDLLLDRFGSEYEKRLEIISGTKFIPIVINCYKNSLRFNSLSKIIDTILNLMVQTEPFTTIAEITESVVKNASMLLVNKYANLDYEIHYILYTMETPEWSMESGFMYVSKDDVVWDKIKTSKKRVLLQLMWALDVDDSKDSTQRARILETMDYISEKISEQYRKYSHHQKSLELFVSANVSNPAFIEEFVGAASEN